MKWSREGRFYNMLGDNKQDLLNQGRTMDCYKVLGQLVHLWLKAGKYLSFDTQINTK